MNIIHSLRSGLSHLILPRRKFLPLFLTSSLVFVGLGVFFAWPADAISISGILLMIPTFILSLFIQGLGTLLVFLIDILIWIIQYNDFINAKAVVIGWVAVRDVVNMFFIVILIVIAIATIVQYQPYHYKKYLPRLLIMAVLINFSRTIAGLFIDFAQVVMMSFVVAFRESASGNFLDMLGVIKAVTFQAGATEIGGFQIFLSYLMALIYIVIALIVIGVYIIVISFRIVALWLLIIMSPLAFFLSTFPKGQKWHQQWWMMFTNYVAVGPILAFFLWLSLAVVSLSSLSSQLDDGIEAPMGTTKGSPTELGTFDETVSFIIGITLLVGGLMMTQQLGVAGGRLAGAAAGKIQAVGVGAARLAGRAAGRAALFPVKATVGGAMVGGRYVARGLGAVGAVVPGAGGVKKFFGGVGKGYEKVAEFAAVPASLKASREARKKDTAEMRIAAAADEVDKARGEPGKATRVKQLKARKEAEEVKNLGLLDPAQQNETFKNAIKGGDTKKARQIATAASQKGTLGKLLKGQGYDVSTRENYHESLTKALTGGKGGKMDEEAKRAAIDIDEALQKQGDYSASGLVKLDEETNKNVQLQQPGAAQAAQQEALNNLSPANRLRALDIMSRKLTGDDGIKNQFVAAYDEADPATRRHVSETGKKRIEEMKEPERRAAAKEAAAKQKADEKAVAQKAAATQKKVTADRSAAIGKAAEKKDAAIGKAAADRAAAIGKAAAESEAAIGKAAADRAAAEAEENTAGDNYMQALNKATGLEKQFAIPGSSLYKEKTAARDNVNQAQSVLNVKRDAAITAKDNEKTVTEKASADYESKSQNIKAAGKTAKAQATKDFNDTSKNIKAAEKTAKEQAVTEFTNTKTNIHADSIKATIGDRSGEVSADSISTAELTSLASSFDSLREVIGDLGAAIDKLPDAQRGDLNTTIVNNTVNNIKQANVPSEQGGPPININFDNVQAIIKALKPPPA